MANRWGKRKSGNSVKFHIFWLQNQCSDRSQEIKTFAPWKKSYNNPRQCIKKQRHHIADKGLYSQSYGFSSSHVQCESWTIQKENWGPKNRCFQTAVLEKTFRVPWTARRSNQSVLKEINPEYSLKRLKLKVQYFGHLIWRTNSLEKTLMLGKIEGKRRRRW